MLVKREITTKLAKSYHLKFFKIYGSKRLKILDDLEKLTNIKIQDILMDKYVLSLFHSTKALNVTSEEIFRNTGTLRLGIFDAYDYDNLLGRLEPKTLLEIKNIVSSKLYKYKKGSKKVLEEELWNEILYAYYLGYYKYYYPLEFYKVIFENEQYYLNSKIIQQGIYGVRRKILELNDVSIENGIIPRKKTINDIALEESLEVILEILARKITIEIRYHKIEEYYQVKIDKKTNKLIFIIKEGEGK